MKMIKLQYLAKGQRRTTIDMHGFEGPAKKPLNSVLVDGGNYLKAGEITTAYQVAIGPSNLFEIIDTQYNRERLRKSSVANERWDIVERYSQELGKYVQTREKVMAPPAFKVLDDTNIHEDIAPVGRAYTEEEVQQRIKEALAGQEIKKTKKGPTEPGNIVPEAAEVKESPKVNRWEKKVAPADPSPIKGTIATPNLEPENAD